MYLFIRVDANPNIGMGHFARCLAVAEEAVKHGFLVAFLSRSQIVLEKAKSLNYQTLNLAEFDSLIDEIPSTTSYLQKKSTSKTILFIDTYEVCEEYISAFASTSKIVYLGSKQFSSNDINLIINYSSVFDEDYYKSHCPQAKTCLGIKYAPLRKEFWNKSTSEQFFNHIFISSGGADDPNITQSIVETLNEDSFFSDYVFEVIIGPLNLHKNSLVSRYQNTPNINLRIDTPSVADIMSQCSFAISAGGTTLYELASKRVATVSFAINAEQEPDAQSFAHLKLALYAGSLKDLSKNELCKRISEELKKLINKKSLYTEIRKNQIDALPNSGTTRIIQSLIGL